MFLIAFVLQAAATPEKPRAVMTQQQLDRLSDRRANGCAVAEVKKYGFSRRAVVSLPRSIVS